MTTDTFPDPVKSPTAAPTGVRPTATSVTWNAALTAASVAGDEVMTGGRLGGGVVTATVYRWTATPPRASDARIATACDPRSPAAGVQATAPVAGSITIPAGPTTSANISGLPFGSATVGA